jgi:hypothetical protein
MKTEIVFTYAEKQFWVILLINIRQQNVCHMPDQKTLDQK